MSSIRETCELSNDDMQRLFGGFIPNKSLERNGNYQTVEVQLGTSTGLRCAQQRN